MLAARDAQGRFGGSELDPSSFIRHAAPTVRKIILWEGKEFEGRMVDPDGKPIAKASIVPLLCEQQDAMPGRCRTRNAAGVSPIWPNRLARTILPWPAR
jgi:hypothetical protein